VKTMASTAAPSNFAFLQPAPGAEERVANLLWRCALQLRQRFDAALLPLGLRVRHFAVLVTLQQSGVMSQQALAQLTCIDPSTTVALLDELQRARLIERRRNPGDRRVHQLHITALGRQRLRQARLRAEAVENAVLTPLTAAQRRQLKKLLAALLTA